MKDTAPVRYVLTSRFQRAYRKLGDRERERFKRALAQFEAHRDSPGLGVKRIQGTNGIWEMRAGRDIRITFEVQDSQDGTTTVVLRNVGHHDATLGSP